MAKVKAWSTNFDRFEVTIATRRYRKRESVKSDMKTALAVSESRYQ